MRNWKFWGKRSEEEPQPKAEPPTERRFSARPRTDLLDPTATSDPARAEKLSRLRRRRESVMFDLEQAEAASSTENAWHERVALLDEALASVRADREQVSDEREPPGRALDPVPIEDIAMSDGPPPSVSFSIGGERFLYQEDIDWAERGTQVARSELHRREGDPTTLLPIDLDEADRQVLLQHLTDSLFTFASDVRDRSLAGEASPSGGTLSDLARPDNQHGGWFDWAGISPAGQRKQFRLGELTSEEQRLLDERASGLEQMARLADRLPIARRRLADVDAEIASLGE